MTKKEQQQIELNISLNSKKVYPKELSYWIGLAATRGSFYDRYKRQ